MVFKQKLNSGSDSEISLPLTEDIRFEEFEKMKDDNQCVQLFAIVLDPKLYTTIKKFKIQTLTLI
jgi:hypothetical protein